jgi:hypothetical protein
MGEEQSIDAADWHADLKQSDSRTAPGIDEDGSVASFDQRSGTKALSTGNWNSSTEQRYSKW